LCQFDGFLGGIPLAFVEHLGISKTREKYPDEIERILKNK